MLAKRMGITDQQAPQYPKALEDKGFLKRTARIGYAGRPFGFSDAHPATGSGRQIPLRYAVRACFRQIAIAEPDRLKLAARI